MVFLREIQQSESLMGCNWRPALKEERLSRGLVSGCIPRDPKFQKPTDSPLLVLRPHTVFPGTEHFMGVEGRKTLYLPQKLSSQVSPKLTVKIPPKLMAELCQRSQECECHKGLQFKKRKNTFHYGIIHRLTQKYKTLSAE